MLKSKPEDGIYLCNFEDGNKLIHGEFYLFGVGKFFFLFGGFKEEQRTRLSFFRFGVFSRGLSDQIPPYTHI